MKILWGRIVIAAAAAEILYMLILQYVFGNLSVAYELAGMIAVFDCLLVAGFVVGRKALVRPVLQGALVGVMAIAFFFVFATAAALFGAVQTGGAGESGAVAGLFVLNHGLKIAGGAAGALIADVLRKQSQSAAS